MGSKLSLYISNICCDIPNNLKNNKDNTKSKNNIICHLKQKKNNNNSFTNTKDLIEPDDIESMELKDFEVKQLIAKGGFSKVYLASYSKSSKLYALKFIPIKNKTKKQMDNIFSEIHILKAVDHPFIINMIDYKVHKNHIVIIMEYFKNGDLNNYLSIFKTFNINIIKFLSTEILLALEYLHSNLNIMYRDLKLQNILIDDNGHIRLTDFGLSKESGTNYDDVANTFCGTMDFIAPEIFLNNYNKAVDLWTFGCILFKMATGNNPFIYKNQKELINKIQNAKFDCESVENIYLKDLILKLIKVNPTERLGYKSINEIKNHPFYNNVIFKTDVALAIKSPLFNNCYVDFTTVNNNNNSQNSNSLFISKSLELSETSKDLLLNDI